MRRWMCVTAVVALLVGSAFIALLSLTGGKSALGAAPKAQGQHTITVTPWGPDQATIDDTKSRLLKTPTLKRFLAGSSRMLSFDFVDSSVKEANPQPPSRFRATFFNYTSNRAIVATGSFQEIAVEVSQSAEQPVPSPEEFEAAVAIVSRDPDLGPAIRDGSLEAYPSMPPLVDIGLPTGKVERTLTVGLMPKNGKGTNEVVGVNMIREAVLRYQSGAPKTSQATALNCGVTNANQTTSGAGTVGQFQVTIMRGTDLLWEFLCLRPYVSSGNNGSGIELQNVKYRGKLVLSRANVPIFNVQYYQNFCGPYRDWAWQEGKFVANGTLVVASPPPPDGGSSGIMLCTDEPKTVIDNGVDSGNFRGVAIYDREEVTLVSELNAGWYRYISKWIFHDEGVISPRFGFGAISNSCVCHGHVHHVYWRFDFDVVTAANNSSAEFNQGSLKTVDTESMRARLNPEQYWTAQNSVTGESVIVKPGLLDGNYDKYGRGDLWLLRSHFPAEIDDSLQPVGTCSTCARIDPMVNGESIQNQDIVVWYGAHWTHDHFDLPPEALGQQLVGPDLILKNY